MNVLKTTAKVAATLSIIATLGWVLVSNDEGEVTEAQADIFWANAGKLTKHTKFVNSLENYGFEPPQQYTWNGVDMFVAKKTTEMSPQEVLYDMQAHFFKEGVNGDIFSRPADPTALGNNDADPVEVMLAGQTAAEFVSGSMIPVSETADHTAMIGVDTVNNATDLLEFAETVDNAEDSNDLFNSMRYVEAFRNGSNRNTTILAIWSDRELKLSQLTPGGGEHRAIPDMPVCMGCEVTSQVEGRGDQDGFVSMTLDSRETPDGALNYYRRALPTRGWEEDQSAALTHRALERSQQLKEGAHTAVFVKENRSMTVQAEWADGTNGSRVSLFSSPD